MDISTPAHDKHIIRECLWTNPSVSVCHFKTRTWRCGSQQLVTNGRNHDPYRGVHFLCVEFTVFSIKAKCCLYEQTFAFLSFKKHYNISLVPYLNFGDTRCYTSRTPLKKKSALFLYAQFYALAVRVEQHPAPWHNNR